LSRDRDALNKLAGRLSVIGSFVEVAFNQPQDVEGVVVGDDI
jgi:hypothetical protein